MWIKMWLKAKARNLLYWLAGRKRAAVSLIGAIGMVVSPLAAAGTLIDVPAGDTAALLDAIHSANRSSEMVLIRLDSQAEYLLNLSDAAPEPVSGQIAIKGQGSHIVGQGARSFGRLFAVLEGGFLELSDLVFRDFDSGQSDLGNNQDGLITVQNGAVLIGVDLRFEHIRALSNLPVLGGIVRNAGQLDLSRVQIVDVLTSAQESSGAIAIFNSGRARLENLLIIDASGADPNSSISAGTYLRNTGNGNMQIRFSSLILASESTSEPSGVSAFRNGGGIGLTPKASFAGTMIVDMECFPFDATSSGFNLFTEELCALDGSSDLVGVSPGALFFRRGENQALEIVLPPGSPALDGVTDADFGCPATDVVRSVRPQDGDQDGLSRCDIGAFENSVATALFAGGENGLFYSADMDGHYVTIQEVRPNEYVVFWNTFDLAGNQAWVLALGARNGNTISTEAYFLPEGTLISGSGADVNTSALQKWGTISIRFENCLSGEFDYESALASFGAGSFDLDRLGFVEGFRCQDP